jgi:hypothetical protein
MVDTSEIPGGYAGTNPASNSTTPRPLRNCQETALRGGAVNARSRAYSRSRSARSAEALTALSTAPS